MNDATASQSGSNSGNYDRLDQLADEFAERYRRGERPSLKEYTDRHPEMAEDILALFPAMVDLEQAEEVRQDGPESGSPPAPAPAMPNLAHVGDYRILREIGHGGMGVVYEAEQVSLGRRVALKMLPRNIALDIKMLERFRREARAAARLHHTNIVPVFEVGREGDSCYYAMQFIQGQGLDLVYEEVRRLRGGVAPEKARRVAIPEARATSTGVQTTSLRDGGPGSSLPGRAEISQVVHLLMTGRFASDAACSVAATGDVTGVFSRSAQPDRTQADTANEAEAGAARESLAKASLSASSTISGVLPGGTQISTVESGRPAYARSVARIGLQAAQGLAYAHARGVVHRDIKPSNLLLDTAGVVWITDFGLAKADDDGLTQTGDILGTLRYMAPERFRGEGDARADVYGLGLTLYELLTLEPAFDAPDRLRLIEQVKSEEPTRPRLHDPRIPRDLETIVLKAIEKDSKRRYPTADEMGEDLRRFLDDEPILARRTTPPERLARWARRNPGVAALGTVLAAVLVLATTASLIVAGRMSKLADRQEKAAGNERIARIAEHEARKHEAALRADAEAAQRRTADALAEAESQRLRAEAGFAKARSVVDGYLTTVSESQLLQVPGMQPLRRDLLQSALTFYEGFVKERGDDPALRAGLASALLRVGKIQGDLGQKAEAKAALDQATALYEALVKGNPTDVELKNDLADCHFQRGRYDQAIALWKSLVRPDVLRFRKELAEAYNGLGIDHGAANRPDPQLAANQQALALWEGLVGAEPENPEYRIGLAGSLNNLGVVLEATGHKAEAVAMFRRGVEHAELAYARSPQVVRYGRYLANGTANVANTLWGLNQGRDEAMAWARKGNDLWKRMAADNPSVPRIQSSFFSNSRDFAFKLRESGRADEASRVMRQARVAFERSPARTPANLYDLACVRALCAELPPGADRDPTFEDDPDERRRFADLAVEALSKAIDAGFKDLNLLRTDGDLKAIRGRDDVRALIAGLEAVIKAQEVASSKAGNDEKLKATATLVAHRERMAAADSGNARLKADLAAGKHAIGLIQAEQGKAEDAYRSFAEEMAIREGLVAADPKAVTPRVDLTMARIVLGEIAWKAGRLAEGAQARERGLEALKALAREQPDDIGSRRKREEAERSLGIDYASKGLWDEAARYRIVERDKIDVNSFGQAALTRVARPAEEYRRFTAKILGWTHPEGGEIELLRALLFEGSAADPGFLARLAEQRKGRPGDDAWLGYCLGLSYYRKGDFAKAVESLSSAQRYQWVVAALAMAHHRLGDVEQAGRELREVEARYEAMMESSLAQTNPGIGPSWWGDVLCVEALRREAWPLIRGRDAPVPPCLHLHRGLAYSRLDEAGKAEAEFAKSVSSRPGDASPWLARGRAFVQIGQEDRAQADFARAGGLASSAPLPWILQGRFLAQRGRRPEAEAAYTRAAELARGDVAPFLDAGWWAVGPYPKDSNLSQPFPPEIDPDPSASVAAIAGPEDLRWRPVPTGDYGKVDLAVPFGRAAQSAYAMTYVYATDDRVATFLLGGDDDVRLWVNGHVVHDDPVAYPDHRAPGMLAPVSVRLRKGRNVLLAKVSNEVVDFYFHLRPAQGSFERGLDFARLGLWGEAADQIRQALDHAPTGEEAKANQRALALLLLLSGDEAGFRAHAGHLIATYGSSTDTSDLNTLRFAYLFSTETTIDGDHLVRMSQTCYEHYGSKDDFLLLELAVARYRAGRFEDAIRTMAEVPRFRDWSPSWVLLALAHHRLGHADEARTWLAKATSWYDSEAREIGATKAGFTLHGDSWWNQLEFELLYREAMRLVDSPGWTDRNRQGLQALAREHVKGFDPATYGLDLALLSRAGQPQLHLARASILADLGRDREAEADLDKAAAQKPGDVLLWKHRAMIHARMGRPGEAAEDVLAARRASPAIDEWWKPEGLGVLEEGVRLDEVFSELVRRDPLWSGYWDARLFEHARRRLWGLAWTDAAEAVARGLQLSMHLSRLSVLQAWNGDRRGLRESCRKILSAYGAVDGSDKYQAREIAVACLLLPDPVADLGPVRRLADLGVTVGGGGADHESFLAVRALVDYRAGDPEAAARRLEKLSLDADDSWASVGRITLALARFRLGREAESRRDLHRASETLRRSRPRLDRGQQYAAIFWQDWLVAEVLLREAEELLLDPGFPADPFVRAGNITPH